MPNSNNRFQEIANGVICALLVTAIITSYSINNQLVILAEKLSTVVESMKELKGDTGDLEKRIRELEVNRTVKQK
jgi:uncharacterized membrane protein (DUF106 family)